MNMDEEEKTEAKVYGPSWFQITKKLTALFLLGGVFLLIALYNINNPDTKPSILAICVVIFVIIVALYFLYEAINGRPNLCLTPNGIEYNFTGRSAFYSWKEVGPFSIDIRGRAYNKYITLCAYSNETHQVINQEEDLYRASYFDGEIRFPLSDLKVARSDEGLYELEDEINRMRDLLVIPEINNVPNSEDQVRKIMKKLGVRLNFWGRLFTAVFTIIFIYAAYKSIPSLITLYSHLVESSHSS